MPRVKSDDQHDEKDIGKRLAIAVGQEFGPI